MTNQSNRIMYPLKQAVDYLKGSFNELRKVVWPTREQAIQYTVIVIVSVLIVTGITAAVDYGLNAGLQQLVNWSQRV